MARRAVGGDIRVRVRRKNLDREFTIMPNALVRGDDDSAYDGLEPIARLFLMCGLTCQEDWETTLADIEEWVGALGRNRNEAIRRQLREAGFLSMQQGRMPNGAFEWQFTFFMTPIPADERDQLQQKKPQGSAARSDDSESPEPGAEPDPERGGAPEETAGQAMPPFSGPHGSGPRPPGPENGGGTPIYEKDHLEKKNPPLPPEPTAAAPSAEGGGEDDPFKAKSNDLTAFVAWFHAQRPDWRRTAIANTLIELQQDGRCRGSLLSAALVLRELVADEPHQRTDFPRRAAFDGAWWAVLRPAKPAAPDRRDDPPCDRPAHIGQRKRTCTACLSEAKAEVAPEQPPRRSGSVAAQRGQRIAEGLLARRSAAAEVGVGSA